MTRARMRHIIFAFVASLAAFPAFAGPGSVGCQQLPAMTGDSTTSTGSCATSVINIGGVAVSTLMATQTPGAVAITGGAINNTPIGGSTANTGAFTNLSSSGTVSGAGFSTYLASPPAIGGSAANTGAFTNLSSSGTVSGNGFSSYLTTNLASPPAIGGTAPNTGAFTTLTSTSTTTLGSGAGVTTTIGGTSGGSPIVNIHQTGASSATTNIAGNGTVNIGVNNTTGSINIGTGTSTGGISIGNSSASYIGLLTRLISNNNRSLAAVGLQGAIQSYYGGGGVIGVTDTSSTTGTVAAQTAYTFGTTQFAATNTGIIYTDLSNVYIGDVQTGSNVTATNSWSLFVNGNVSLGSTKAGAIINIGGNNGGSPVTNINAGTAQPTAATLNMGTGGTVNIAVANTSGGVNIATGASNANISMGNASGATLSSQYVAVYSRFFLGTGSNQRNYASWGLGGTMISTNTAPQTLNDNTTPTGTLAAQASYALGPTTQTATNTGVIITDLSNLYVGAISAGTNVTATNLWSGYFAGAVRATSYTSTSQFISTVATGTAPLVVSSTTNVPNLNASSLNGATFASPGVIGGTSASAVNMTNANITLSLKLLTGSLSGTAWSTAGIAMYGQSFTATDTSSTTGTTADSAAFAFGAPTTAATNTGVIYTDLSTFYVPTPIAGTNVTATNLWSIKTQGGIKVGGALSGAAGTFTGLTVNGSAAAQTYNWSSGKSAAAWGTAGVAMGGGGFTYTDTTSSGTVADVAMTAIPGFGIAASSATVYTDASLLYLGTPAFGTNASATNTWSLKTSGGIKVGGNVTVAGTANITGTTTLGTSNANFTGSNVISINGVSISAAAWGTAGRGFTGGAPTYTDTTSPTGTTADSAAFAFPAPTTAATNTGVIYTDLTTLYLPAPIAGTNVTGTNLWSLKTAGGIKVGGTATFNGTVNANVSNGAVITNIGTGTTTGAVNIGGGSNAVVMGSTVQLKSYTVAGLPAAGTAGRTALVTDATAPTYLGTLTGGGTVKTPVVDNGTAWVSY